MSTSPATHIELLLSEEAPRVRAWLGEHPAAEATLGLDRRTIEDAVRKVYAEERGQVNSAVWKEIASELKERLSFVAADLRAELERQSATSELGQNMKLPGGQTITVDDPRFRVPEVLFQPWLLGLEQDGIVDAVVEAIRRLPPDVRDSAWADVRVLGALGRAPGLAERLETELRARAPAGATVRVTLGG